MINSTGYGPKEVSKAEMESFIKDNYSVSNSSSNSSDNSSGSNDQDLSLENESFSENLQQYRQEHLNS